MNFLHVLERSYVGRLVNGGEAKTLQLNFCLEGFREVKVAVLGGGFVLISSDKTLDLQKVFNSSQSWRGALENVTPWSPNKIPVRRDIWVNIYGVPLQCWGETLFRMITEEFGAFLFMDAETRNKSRMDVARVKLSCPLLGTIDRVIPVVVQGCSLAIRVVEERGFVFDDDRLEQVDQLRWCAAASSCKSFEQAPAMAVVEESVLGEFDSDGLLGGQGEEHDTGETNVDLLRNKNEVDNLFVLSESRLANSSTCREEKQFEGDISVGVTAEVSRVRGLTSLEDSDGCENLKSCEVLVGPTNKDLECDVMKGRNVSLEGGPNQVGVVAEEERRDYPSGPILEKRVDLSIGPPVAGPVYHEEGVEGMLPEDRCVGNKDHFGPEMGPPMSVNLDSFLQSYIHKNHKSVSASEVSDNISFSQIDMKGNGVIMKAPSKGCISKSRRPLPGMQSLPSMGVPKCLRFVEAIQSSSRKGKSRRAVSLEEGLMWSAERISRGSRVAVVEDKGGGDRVVEMGGSVSEVSSSSVHLPHQPETQIPEVNWLMCEDSLENVDNFVELKKHPDAIQAEAAKILEIQSDLGLKYVSEDPTPRDLLVEMEIRDQQKMVENEEAQHFQ
ncbi:hypothetical protein P8452_12998 [Trifolium repens]|nr:hypothetical protein P8452_12998 [Trifolium repens]